MEKPNGLSMSRPILSLKSKIVLALTEANCFRGAEVSEQYLRLFAARLEQENPEYLFPALSNLSEQVREDGDPSLLTLGMILQEIKLLTPRKKTACEIESEEIFAEQRAARERVN